MRLALISCFMFLSSLFHPAYSSSSIRPLCRIDESSALLQFKESFIVNSSNCAGPDYYPKVASWMLEGENSSCCLWDGVDCDDDTGHVIGLNLSSSCLYGSINSSSSLFRLMNLRHLKYLSVGQTGFSGEIPASIGNLDSLERLDLRDCKFSGLIPHSLEFLDIRSNNLQGSLPIPQSPIFFYSISKNELTGEISPLFCNLTFLEVLDLSENNLSGKIPKCLGNFSNSLTILNLRRNNLHGTIPHTWTIGNKLRMIDVGDNKLRGQVPKSIVNCMLLENLDLGNNQLNDSFPFWLATLPELKILILRSNYFHGPIAAPEFSLVFPKLRILDISCNSITGSLPSKFFQSWNAMKIVDDGQLGYMQVKIFVFGLGSPGHFSDHYDYSMIMTNKHLTTQYYKIIEVLEIIDFSHNRFEGLIPESLELLRGFVD
nr:receptor-like protein 9DC1 [Quercus suber]